MRKVAPAERSLGSQWLVLCPPLFVLFKGPDDTQYVFADPLQMRSS